MNPSMKNRRNSNEVSRRSNRRVQNGGAPLNFVSDNVPSMRAPVPPLWPVGSMGGSMGGGMAAPDPMSFMGNPVYSMGAHGGDFSLDGPMGGSMGGSMGGPMGGSMGGSIGGPMGSPVHSMSSLSFTTEEWGYIDYMLDSQGLMGGPSMGAPSMGGPMDGAMSGPSMGGFSMGGPMDGFAMSGPSMGGHMDGPMGTHAESSMGFTMGRVSTTRPKREKKLSPAWVYKRGIESETCKAIAEQKEKRLATKAKAKKAKALKAQAPNLPDISDEVSLLSMGSARQQPRSGPHVVAPQDDTWSVSWAGGFGSVRSQGHSLSGMPTPVQPAPQAQDTMSLMDGRSWGPISGQHSLSGLSGPSSFEQAQGGGAPAEMNFMGSFDGLEDFGLDGLDGLGDFGVDKW